MPRPDGAPRAEADEVADPAVHSGRRVLVTGGGSGIGEATARALARAGARVAVADVDAPSARRVANGIDGLAVPLDVTDEEAVAEGVGHAIDEFGGLDGLFNNAGEGLLSPFLQTAPEQWRRVMDVSLTGVYSVTRHCLPALLEAAREGHHASIVNMASTSAGRPVAGEGPYAAAKAGVVALTASLAHEFGPGVRVNSVSPGMIETRLTERMFTRFPAEVDEFIRATPLRRLGSPQEVADVVLFLLSQASRFITGQNFVVDGGLTLRGSGLDRMLEAVVRQRSASRSHHNTGGSPVTVKGEGTG